LTEAARQLPYLAPGRSVDQQLWRAAFQFSPSPADLVECLGRRDAIESRVDVVEPSTSVRSDDIMRASTITSSARPSALVMPVLRRPTRGGQDATR
jgi:hypothetical protein